MAYLNRRLHTLVVVWANGVCPRFLDKLEIAESGEVHAKILESIWRLVDDENIWTSRVSLQP